MKTLIKTKLPIGKFIMNSKVDNTPIVEVDTEIISTLNINDYQVFCSNRNISSLQEADKYGAGIFGIDRKRLKTLYRPVNQNELDSIEKSGCLKFPPRLPQQPIFYPVMNKEYAIQISRQWNVPAYGSGFVVEFKMDSIYLDKFEIHTVGGDIHQELWVPAEELDEFNKNIVGKIEVIESFFKD